MRRNYHIYYGNDIQVGTDILQNVRANRYVTILRFIHAVAMKSPNRRTSHHIGMRRKVRTVGQAIT